MAYVVEDIQMFPNNIVIERFKSFSFALYECKPQTKQAGLMALSRWHIFEVGMS